MTREQYNEMMNNSKEEHTKNINHAIELRTSKANNTEFYYKLNNLTDKIKRFKVKFGDWDQDHIPPLRERTPSLESIQGM